MFSCLVKFEHLYTLFKTRLCFKSTGLIESYCYQEIKQSVTGIKQSKVEQDFYNKQSPVIAPILSPKA